MTTFYTSDRKTPVSGIALFLLSFLLAPLLAIAYMYAVWYLPVVYLQALAIAGLALGLVYSVKYLVVGAKSRNVTLNRGLAIGLAAWTWYCRICVYIAFLLNAGPVFERTIGLRRPSTVSMAMTSFDLDKFLAVLPRPGLVFPVLAEMEVVLPWLELPFLVGFVAYRCWNLGTKPFSYVNNAWMHETELPYRFAVPKPLSDFQASLQNGNLAPLLEADLIHADSPYRGEIRAFSSEGDPNTYITVTAVVEGVDKEGKEVSQKANLVTYLQVPASEFEQVEHRFWLA